MTQQYNFTSNNHGNLTSDPMTNVPEDFDFTNFLLENRPRVPENSSERQPADDGWPQRVQDVKQPGNPMSHFAMQDSYAGRGWSPMGTDSTEFGGIRDSRTSMYGSSFWEPTTESNSVFHGATNTTTATTNPGYNPTNPGYNPSTLGCVGSNPGLESNLSRIWSSDGAALSGNRMRSNTGGSGVDFGAAATEGRDMYEYAWNEWERPINHSQTSSPSHTANPDVSLKKPVNSAVKGNVRHSDGNVEDLRAAFFSGGNRKDRGESSVSVQSSASCQSRGVKDGCSNSSKTYSDIMKGGRPSNKMPHDTARINQAKAKSSSSNQGFPASKIPSHYQKSVTPPPGFESSALHEPVGPDTGYGLDDFMGTSAKVQRWLQQSQSQGSEGDDQTNVTKRKRTKKKKKSKKPDPLAGSVASFIRDWNSGTSESTDPCSLDDLAKISSAYRARTVDTPKKEKPENKTFNNTSKMESKIEDIPIKKEEKAFFDPKRIFKETSKKPEEKTEPDITVKSTQNFFDPKRIFQAKTAESKDDSKSRSNGNPTRMKTSSENARSNLDQTGTNSEHCFSKRSVPVQESAPNHIHRGIYSIPVEEIGTDTTTTTTTNSSSSSPNHTGSGLWREHLSGTGDNNNKGPIKNKGSYYGSDTSGVQSMKHGTVKGHQISSGARLDSSSAKGQHAKPKSSSNYVHKDFTPPKVRKEEEAEMRTRSQSRREAEQPAFEKHQHHFVPGTDEDGNHFSSRRYPSHQDSPSTSKDHYHEKDSYAKESSGSAAYHNIPTSTEKLRKTSKSPPQPSSASSSKHQGRSQHQAESEPGWKKNKTSRGQRTGKHGREKKDLPRRHRTESPSTDRDCNGSAPTNRHKDRHDRAGRGRKDSSEGPKGADTASHYYDGDQVYQWMKAIVRFASWIVGFVVFLFLVLTAYLFSTCKVWIEYILHIITELWKIIAELLGYNNPDSSPRWWNSWVNWFKKSKDGSHDHSRHGSDGNGSKNGRGKHAEFVDIPSTSVEAIARIMACDPEDAYAVLGVGDAASDDDIKKYYRKQCVMVHPDKCNLRHANDAFQMLQKGYETLTDPSKRYDLDRQRASACETEDMLNDIYEKMKEAMNTLNCNMCENKHKRYPVDRPCYAARYCSRHDDLHGAVEGDMWAETTHLGFKWHYYACMDDEVFDITEWAKCQNLRHMESNACEVRYRIGSNRRRQPGQFRPADEPPPWQQYQQGFEDFRNGDEELDDLLRHLFGDRASRTANDPRSSGHNSNRSSSNRKRRHRKKKY